MAHYLKIFTVLLISLFFAGKVAAHDPSQITYYFQKDGSLQVHLTPKGAVDLLTTIVPELNQQAVINPNDYYDTFTAYFNETIHLQVGGESLDFSFLNADLAGHDAVMNFQVNGFSGDYTGYELQLNSFTDVYRRVSNHVKIELPDQNQLCQLGQREQKCIDNRSAANETSTSSSELKATRAISSLGWVAGASILAVLLFLYVKPN